MLKFGSNMGNHLEKQLMSAANAHRISSQLKKKRKNGQEKKDIFFFHFGLKTSVTLNHKEHLIIHLHQLTIQNATSCLHLFTLSQKLKRIETEKRRNVDRKEHYLSLLENLLYLIF